MSVARIIVAFALWSGAVPVLAADSTAAQPPLFAQRWNSGIDPKEPPFHVQAIDQDTYAIRQSLKTTFEAPFMYLLFGTDKALLIDTGVEGGGLRDEVDRLIEARRSASGRNLQALVVMHTHAHGDHVGGDKAFAARAKTTVIAHTASDVASFFGIKNWPDAGAKFDLGRRSVEILPTPGHHDSHVMIYDPQTRILFSGDTIYPGRLYFRCDKAHTLLASIERVQAFASKRAVHWILGAHIEMSAAPGQVYAQEGIPSLPGQSLARDTGARANEHALELPAGIIADIRRALAPMVDRPRPSVHDHFMLYPHPADPRGKTPPDWCTAP